MVYTASPHPGVYLRQLIEQSGVTQAAVARTIGITTKHLNQILQRRALPSITVAIHLASELGMDPQDLWRMVCDYQLGRALAALRERDDDN